MKKAAVFFVFLIVVIGAIYFRNSASGEEKAPGDKYIGAVSVTLYEEQTAIPGKIVSRCYLEKQEMYEQDQMVTFTDTMPRFTQLAEDFTTATTTTTTTTKTETKPQSGDQESATPEEGAVSDLEVKYVGELFGAPTYTIYDSKFKVQVEPQERLELPTEPGLYYVESDVKWGKKKNYTQMKYYFIIEVIQ